VAVGTYPRSTGCLQVGPTPARARESRPLGAACRAAVAAPAKADDAPAETKQIYELSETELSVAAERERPDGFKCATLGASPASPPHLATGSFNGRLQVWDLERGAAGAPVFDAQAHASIVNAADGFGGRAAGYGPPEIATAGRDGAVRVWDVRQADAPVAAFEPADGGSARCAEGAEGWAVAGPQRGDAVSHSPRPLSPILQPPPPRRHRDCWAVAIGNSFNDEERCVLAGYDNGDVKLFDLRTNKVSEHAHAPCLCVLAPARSLCRQAGVHALRAQVHASLSVQSNLNPGAVGGKREERRLRPAV
jgi:hypothetical protein